METTLQTKSEKQVHAVKILKDKVQVHYMETIHEMHFDKSNTLVKEDKFHKWHPIEADFPPHEDFLVAMKMIRKIVIAICGWKGEFKNFDLYTVTGLHFHGMDEDETAKVVITANKKIERSKQVFTFNTPPTTLFDVKQFDDAEELDKACKVVIDEAMQYLNGKHAEPKQLSLEFESGENVTLTVQKGDEEQQPVTASTEDDSYMEPGTEV